MKDFNNNLVVVINGGVETMPLVEFEAIKEEEKKRKWLEDMMSDPN